MRSALSPAPQSWLSAAAVDDFRQTFRFLSFRRSLSFHPSVTVKVLGVCVVFHIDGFGSRRVAVLGDVKYSNPFWAVLLAWKTSARSSVVSWAQAWGVGWG